jgi:hypothetical protein
MVGEELHLVVRVQRGLVAAHMAGDSGEWVFTLCKAGMERLLGRRLRVGEELEVLVRGEECDRGVKPDSEGSRRGVGD